jgi:cell division protein FtsQ
VSRGGLISPRGRASSLSDLGERSPLVAGQRVDRVRRRRAGRSRRWRSLPPLLLLVLAPAVLGLAVHWILTAPHFAVAAVEVQGASRVPADDVRTAAGIVPGSNLWRLDTRGVLARVEAMPEIRHARVIRALPNRVTIVVEERRPFTLVHGGRLHWMDEEGRVLGEASQVVAPPLPVVSGLSDEELASMRSRPAPRARVAIDIIRTLLRTGSGLVSQISEIDMSGRDGPVLYTVDGVEIRLGGEAWEERLARLEAVLAQVATQDVTTVDLRFRDQVVLQRGDREGDRK